MGSPPQVRGKLRYNIAKVIQIRITPAGAGKTCNKLTAISSMEDHPRRCGENDAVLRMPFNTSGSPPQVRGKHRTLEACRRKTGITPAGAGKTYGIKQKREVVKDHPRRCGENQDFPFLYLMCLGSPPQVRGKRAMLPLNVN